MAAFVFPARRSLRAGFIDFSIVHGSCRDDARELCSPERPVAVSEIECVLSLDKRVLQRQDAQIRYFA